MTLHFDENPMNIDLLNISINGCDVCGTILCNYTACNNEHELIDYINDIVLCNPKYDGTFYNKHLLRFSVIHGIITIMTIVIIIFFLCRERWIIYHRRKRKKFISNRPWNYILYNIIFAEIIIFTGIFYWAIKLTLFYHKCHSILQSKISNNG